MTRRGRGTSANSRWELFLSIHGNHSLQPILEEHSDGDGYLFRLTLSLAGFTALHRSCTTTLLKQAQ